MNWLHYLVEANLYLAIFYSVYYLFLSRETHYTLNRVYLLLSSVVSFVIPVIQLGILKPAEQPFAAANYVHKASGILAKPIQITLIAPQYTWEDYLFFGYLAGSAVLLLMLLFRFYQLFRLTRANKKAVDAAYNLVYLDDTNTAFSFFNFLFIGTKTEGIDTIIKHELVHIRQKHSADIVFIEVLKIINWFNPFIYLLQFSLKALHEYIADEQTAASETDALTYSSFLVQNAYGLSGTTITHSFFNYNLLKKRIIMLNQKRSGNLARLKYLLAVPICGGLLCASTLSFSKDYGWVDIAPMHKIDTPKVIDVKLLPPPPPPAPPLKPAFTGLSKYLGKHLLYPAKAHDNHLGGNIMAKFYLNSDHKISDVKIVKGIGNGFDEEVVSVLKSYPLTINDKTGSHPYYTINVNFSLIGDKGEIKTKSVDPIVINNPNYIGMVQIIGFVK